MHPTQHKPHRTRGQVPRRCRARRGLDANGNLTSDGQHHFIYDAANRLNQVDIVQGEQASNVTYLHNALGQRVFKSERQDAQIDSSESPPGISLVDLFIRFFYWLFNIAPAEAILGQSYLYDDATLGDSPSLLGEYGNGGNLSQGNAEYIWLPTESGQAQLIGLYKNQRFYAIHTDHLGTPRLITDDSNQVVWQWAYSAFGDNPPTGILQATPNPDSSASPAVLLKATAPQITMNLRMAGQYFDEESGLFENGFRSYRPGMGAYTQPDPLGLGGGISRYVYVGGNPLSFVDPLGLYTEIVVWTPAGIGSSSFGHVSTNVNGTNHSWGPGGWDTKYPTASAYNKRQGEFRGGTGVMLNLSPTQEAGLAACLKEARREYSVFSNNCGTPAQECLKKVGIDIGSAMLPKVILENMKDSPISNGTVSYPSPRGPTPFTNSPIWR